MSIDTGAFVVGTILARNQGVKSTAAANRAGLLMGLGGLSATGLLLAESSIDSERRGEKAGAVGQGGYNTDPPCPTPMPTSSPSGGSDWPVDPQQQDITAGDLKVGFAQIVDRLDVQNETLMAAIQKLTDAVAALKTASGDTGSGGSGGSTGSGSSGGATDTTGTGAATGSGKKSGVA